MDGSFVSLERPDGCLEHKLGCRRTSIGPARGMPFRAQP
jgi:hypothetical protein